MRLIVFILLITVAFAQITLPPFRQMTHDIQSGPIEVINNNTLRISKFYFDGKAPRAHFWVGKGQPSANGTKVPYSKDTGTLPMLSNENVTLQLQNLTINDIDYLSVWCEDVEMSLGHVFTTERWIRTKNGSGMILPKTIGPFRRTDHEVSSGNIVLLDEKSIFIPNFKYDGKSASAQFWLGSRFSSSNGKFAYTSSGMTVLSKHDNKNVTVILPNNFTVGDFDYLSVRDSNNSSFGQVYFNDTSSEIEMYIGKQFEGFENKQYGLRSGPIILANKNTVYVTNFHYRGFQNEFFWAGSEREPADEGVPIPNQAGFLDNIEEDDGSSFYVTLPERLPENEAKYFGIWDNKTKALLVKISFTNDNKYIPAKITEDGRRIIRYPKCCPHKLMMDQGGCVSTDLILDNSIPVHYANLTHLNDDPMVPDRLMHVPYHNNLSCPRYFLDSKQEEDKFLYLTSGLLLFPGNQAQGIYKQDDFCLDLIEIDEIVYHAAFICHYSNDMSEGLRILICIFIFLSAICLLLTAGIFFIVTDRYDMRGASIAGFAGFMGIAFICLFFTQAGLESEKLCNVLGFIFQFFIVSSLIWLDALCFEMYYNIKYYNHDSILGDYKKRLIWYSTLALVIPLIFVFVSLSFSIPVGLINVNLDRNCFLNVSNKKWLLYMPILLTILVAIGLTVYNYIEYYRPKANATKPDGREVNYWIHVKRDVKTRLMLCVFLVVFTSLCWISEIITYTVDTSWEPLDFLHALQGVFTMIIVLSTGQIWKRLLKRLGCCTSRSSVTDNAQETELMPINNNGEATTG